AASAEAGCGVRCLSCLWSWSQHRQKGVSAGNQGDCSQTSGINSLCTGNDDGVADLNIGDSDCGQALKHVVDIRTAGTSAWPTWATGTWTSRSRLSAACWRLASGCCTCWPTRP